MDERWSNEMHNRPKLRTYVQIKDIFEPEPYVLSNNILVTIMNK